MTTGNIDRDDLCVSLASEAPHDAHTTHCDEIYGDTTEDFQVAFNRIQLPSNSSMGTLLSSPHDGSYKAHLGLKVEEFDGLHDLFKNGYLEKTQANDLRPLETELALALVLKWRYDKRSRSVLGLLFGVDGETVSNGVQLGSDILDDIHTYKQYSRRR